MDAIEVDDGRTVDAAEGGRIKILLQFRYAAAQHVGSLSDVEAGVVVGGFDPIDLGGSQERDTAGALDDEAIQFSWEIFA